MMKQKKVYVLLYVIILMVLSSFAYATERALYDDCTSQPADATKWFNSAALTADGVDYEIDGDEPVNTTQRDMIGFSLMQKTTVTASSGGKTYYCLTPSTALIGASYCSSVADTGYTVACQSHTALFRWEFYDGAGSGVEDLSAGTCTGGVEYNLTMIIQNVSTNQYVNVWVDSVLLFNYSDNTQYANNWTFGISSQSGGSQSKAEIRDVHLINRTPAAPPPTPANSSSIDLLFKNSTSGYKTLFQESENFEVYINYTDDLDNSSLTDSFGICNITTANGILENIGTEDNFELCGSGCDNKTYSFETNLHTNISYFQDFIRLEVCNAQTAAGFITANISCGVNTYSEIIAGVNIPLCNGNTFGEFFINSSVCANFNNVNVSITSDVATNRRKEINIIELDREYIKHFNIVLFNVTDNLWYINHTHEYYNHGSKEIFANCSYSIDDNFNNSISENITVVNRNPIIPPNHQVNTSLGLTNISNKVNITYASGVWNWLISITDDDIDQINYTIYNSSGDILASYVSTYPVIFNTSDALFADFANPFNLTVFANDTLNNVTQGSILFNVTDVDIPTFSGFDNTSQLINTNYTWTALLSDEHLWEFEIKCNNSDAFSFSTTSIGSNSYNFVNNQTNITGNTLCNFNVTDGHTGQLIKDFNFKINTNSFSFDNINILSEQSMKDIIFTKEYDRYSFCIETSNIENYLFLTMPDECKKYPSTDYKGWYVCNNKYWIDFETEEDYPVWTDGNQAVTVDIRTAASKEICFNSIGVLNRASGSQLITASIPTVSEDPYNNNIINATKWFNTDALDTSTTAGVLLYLFIFIILVGFIVYAEFTRIPALFVLAGIVWFFFALLIYTLISAIIGIIILVFALFFIIRGIMISND